MAQLDHPHIVRVFDQRLLPERKMRLLYMQYIPGGTLQPVVELVRQLPPSERSGATLLKVIDGCLERRGVRASEGVPGHTAPTPSCLVRLVRLVRHTRRGFPPRGARSLRGEASGSSPQSRALRRLRILAP